MEFNYKMVLNRSFLTGIVCGFIIAGCLIFGLLHNKNDTSVSHLSLHTPNLQENNTIDLKLHLSNKDGESLAHRQNNFANGNNNGTIRQPYKKLEISNAEPVKVIDKIKSEDRGFIPIENQIVDVNWAPEFTNKLVDTFQLSDELYSLGLITDIECKTTLCEIQFDFNSPEDFSAIFRIRDAFEQTSLKKHGLVFDFQEQENTVKILVGRNDNSFRGIYQ